MDNKELNNEEMVNEHKEEVVEATNDLETEVSLEEVAGEMFTETKEDSKAMKFLKKALAGLVDQIIGIAVALVLLIVFDFILKLVGFYIAEREPMFLIMYVIFNIFYRPICSLTKLKDTIGTRTIIK